MKRTRQLAFLSCFSVLAILFGGCKKSNEANSPEQYEPRPKGQLTFNKDIAPILFAHCSGCHRPGQAAPFSLLSYPDAKKHAEEIVKVTKRRFMPPWLPEPGYGEFAGARRLTVQQIGLLEQWVAEGTIAGQDSDLPTLPQWTEGWRLGNPDLVIEMAEPYQLSAEGKDVYRNFVMPVPVSQTRYVQAVEMRPGNPKVIHHAVMQIDRTPSSRLLDAQDPEPGFSGGMSLGNAQLPGGHFIGWTPGKMPLKEIEGASWELHPGTDLILQLHMRPSGRRETIEAKFGFYFSDSPPTRHLYSLVLRSKFIDIASGESDYTINQNSLLPIDVQVIGVYPHAHYLGKEMDVAALLPDGSTRWLLRIKSWDFNWQDEYRYLKPIFLPTGTSISMRYTYDNSASNVRNPNQPPKRVVYGQKSTDEMAELMLQVMPESDTDLEILKRYSAYQAIVEDIALNEERLKTNQNDAKRHKYLGTRYQQIGKAKEAIAHFVQAARLEPGSAESNYLAGDALAQTSRFDEGAEYFRAALRSDSNHIDSLTSLARVLATHPNPSSRESKQSILLAERAAQLTQRQDPGVLDTLAVAYAADGQFDQATETVEAAIKIASSAGADEIVQQIQRRLDRFKQGLPYVAPVENSQKHLFAPLNP